jgi:hypothetical protein
MSDGGGLFTRSKRVLPKRPELTAEKAMKAVEEGFAAGKYKVYPTKLVGADFVVRKSAWTGIAVKIKQSQDKTTVIYNPFSPSAGARLAAYGLIPILILNGKSWKPIRKEFQEFLDRTPLFKP